MHLSIIISRFSNLLVFVQKTDKHNLVKFDLQKYLTDKNFNLSFYEKSENKIWRQIEKSIGEENTKQIKKSIVLLKPAFALYWRKTSKHLLLWKRYFQNNQPLFQQIVFKVKKLSGIKHFKVFKIPIYLISDPISKDKEINARFSWTPKKSFIVIGIPLRLKVPNNFFPVSVLIHEFFHLILRENKNLIFEINKVAEEDTILLTKLSKEHMLNRMFLEELLISSFIPEGYISEKYFGIKVDVLTSKPKDLLEWRRFIAFKMQNTAKKYINDARQIDKNYLRHIIEIIKENAK